MDLFSSIVEPEDARLSLGGGRFRARALEAAFQADGLDGARRHARLLFAFAAIVNTAFLPVDWRFVGTPQFWVAVPARACVILTALACLLLVRGPVASRMLKGALAGWMAGTAIGVALLVTSRSLIAQFVVVILPIAYYMAVPLPLRWVIAGGGGCSALLLFGFCAGRPAGAVEVGLILATLTMNVALAMSAARAGGHAREAWAATRAALRLGAALDVSRVALSRMFLASPVPLVLTDADARGGVKALSRSAARLLGNDSPATLRDYYADVGADDPLLVALARDNGSAEIEVTATLNGETRTLLLKAASIELPQDNAILTGILDITERKAVQINLEQIASTDSLTGLRNRLSFFATARAEMTRVARTRTPLCLLMIDVDHFKAINDTYGHAAGDAVLRNFAQVTTVTLGPDAIVGRLGGEEFGVLLPDATAGARHRAEKLREAIATARTACENTHLAITISIGIARLLPNERDLDQALARADFALYAAKKSGRNRVMSEEETGWVRATG